MPSERPDDAIADLYGPALSQEETAAFYEATGLMHWTSRWCGLISFSRCGFRVGEMCDGWCERERREGGDS
jgi:hypothetical protein